MCDDVAAAVALLEEAVKQNEYLIWEIGRITNGTHSVPPFGAGFGITVIDYTHYASNGANTFRAWEKAGDGVAALEAAKRALARTHEMRARYERIQGGR